MAAALITIQNGTVDYCTDEPIQVVIVDFDAFDPDTSFPDDVEAVMREVLELPDTIPWRGGVVKRLQETKRAIQAELLSGPTYAKVGNYGLGISRSNASRDSEPETAQEPV